ncbi:MAG: AmmeMemoRadiSam system protein B [Syntrophaceae bacterium]|nr:AmmeMemoRadiSam system protein B [Syntrophaceae bacterium]
MTCGEKPTAGSTTEIYLRSLGLLPGSLPIGDHHGKDIRKSVSLPAPGTRATPGSSGARSAGISRTPRLPPSGRIVGLVSPHAGYRYSGPIAARGYRLIEGQRYDAVVVIGPSHRVLFRGASVWPSGGSETPLEWSP